nr:hypothetical protein GCM10020092_047050 [Actinoplanes digitatis]
MQPEGLNRTARITGLFYLGNAITSVLGFIVIRPRLFDADDPTATMANLVAHDSPSPLGHRAVPGHGRHTDPRRGLVLPPVPHR